VVASRQAARWFERARLGGRASLARTCTADRWGARTCPIPISPP
jgi:hypothetical protein